MNIAMMRQQRAWTEVLLFLFVLVCAVQLLCGQPLYGQNADVSTAAAAKAAVGRKALTYPAANGPASKVIGTFVSFDAPGAVTGTFPFSINAAGEIAGTYSDGNLMGHFFLRASDGAFTTFDVPGRVPFLGLGFGGPSINPAKLVTGAVYDPNDPNIVAHGFLRASDGTLTTFDAPGAGTGFFQGTEPFSINPAGSIAGAYLDAGNVAHGFLRAKDGTFTTFDVPGAATINGVGPGFFVGSQPIAIQSDGTTVGTYNDADYNHHGFMRAPDGTFTTFDPPGNIGIFGEVVFSFGTNLYINPAGVITGTYFSENNFHVFVRALDGTFTTFDAATNPICQVDVECLWSFPSGISPSGEIVGSFNDPFTINHGFLRARDGTLTAFDAPGAGNGFNQGTGSLGITPSGVIMGLYIDANSVNHGFLLLRNP